MKTLKEYINESKSFVLNDSERDALSSVIGVLSDSLEDDDMKELFKDFSLTDKEKEQLSSLFDVLDDRYTYKRVNSSLIKDDIKLLIKIIRWMDDNDAWYHHNDYELLDVLDKLEAK